jgi:hypothetical protein
MRSAKALLIVLALAPSVAAARPSTTTMSCGEAAATVARAGAIVLSTGEFTYDRFVAHNGYCLPGQQTEPGIAPTTDSRACQIGYICRDRIQFQEFD